MGGVDFKRFDMSVGVLQIVRKLDPARMKQPLPAAADDMIAQLAASLRAMGISDAAIEARIGKASPTQVSVPVRTDEAHLSDLIGRLDATLNALLADRAEAANPDVAHVLSASQLRTWGDCQARWAFHYLYEMDEPQNSKLALGSAVHTALAENFFAKASVGEDLPAAEVAQGFRAAWDAESDRTLFLEGEDPAELADKGEALVAAYMRDNAPALTPGRLANGAPAVEFEVEGSIAGVAVRGRVDLMDDTGMVIDFKTAAKKPVGLDAGAAMQLAIYNILEPQSSGKVRVDTLVKTKALQLVSHTYQLSAQDLAAPTKQLPIARDGMRSGLYSPNRGSMLCSRKNCGFWSACQDEFGGFVKS